MSSFFQIQTANEQKDQLDELLTKEKVWEDREVEWKSMQERLNLYKSRAKEARWWEKTCDEVIHERDSLRMKVRFLFQSLCFFSSILCF